MNLLVKVESVQDRGLSLDQELAKGELTELLHADPPTGFQVEAAAALEARVTRVKGSDLLFEGKLELRLGCDCRRCLAKAVGSVPVSFKLELVRRDGSEELEPPPLPVEDDGMGEIAGTFTPEEANLVYYSGHEIDLAPILREQLLLALPIGLLCDQDCKGLCQSCGQDLNVEECGCDRHVPDPRWAALKSIKL